MPKALWFALGFGAALLLAAILIVGPLANISADKALTPTPIPAALMATPPRVIATPTPLFLGLQWHREGGLHGQCEHLSIDGLNQAHFAPGDEGTRLVYLTQDELAAYLGYIDRYAPFEYAAQDHAGGFTGAVVRLEFTGRGNLIPTEGEQKRIVDWACAVYERVTREERRADLVAEARVHLSQRLGIPVDTISTKAVASVTWSDPCLGIKAPGLFCAQVLTPGYRVLLRADDNVYEYRTDLYDAVRLVEDPSTALPPVSISEPSAE